jgi:hypothetical protein
MFMFGMMEGHFKRKRDDHGDEDSNNEKDAGKQMECKEKSKMQRKMKKTNEYNDGLCFEQLIMIYCFNLK